MYPFLLTATAPVALYWAIPFVVLLGCIAICPVVAHHFWEKHYPKIAITLGLIVAVYYLAVRREYGTFLHEMQEYVSFIALLGSLYIVSGGVLIRIRRTGTPWVNATLLIIGALLANVMGTTGASMLLIRPFLRMNRSHLKPYHVVFFIFIVSNVGGGLTPIGDPPLFLGYLQGVPFMWVFEHCNLMWAMVVGLLVGVFLVIDTIDHRKAMREHPEPSETPTVLQVTGIHNFIFIGVIILAVFQPGFFDLLSRWTEHGFTWSTLGRMIISREILMIVAAVASRAMTAREIYQHNDFSYHSIKEVAILFIGIFATMVPALGWLQNNAEKLPVRTPGQYYFMTGGLSALLDNAPTYLTFLELKLARLDPHEVEAVQSQHPGYTYRDAELHVLTDDPKMNLALVGISMGAVFFGAMTYIGNGPNFMVKSIAEKNGAKTPNFVQYVYLYALPILLPILVLVWAVFLL